MKITGIITEYNPFHLGHLYHLTNAKKDTDSDAIICIMSGNFMQRGMPALIDKWERAKIAIANGVDLVIELPLVYSNSSAEWFSYGACSILNSTGVVDSLYFGSEHGNIAELKAIANTIVDEPHDYKSILKAELSKGLPFHSARKTALEGFLPNINCEEILSNSNNILAIEYLKALIKLNSPITPYTLKRSGANYNERELKTDFPSATSIRNSFKEHKDLSYIEKAIPKETLISLNNLINKDYCFTHPDDMYSFLKYKIMTEGQKLSSIYDVSEGLDNKILKEISRSQSLDDLILNVKSKRYTYTRISRILTSFFIGLDNYNIKDILSSTPDYIRPLAFNNTGSKILKEIKNKDQVNILTKIPRNIDNKFLELDLLGTRAYSILNTSISPYDDYLRSPIYLE